MSSKERGPGDGYLRQLGTDRGALGNTNQYLGVLSYLHPLDHPALRIPTYSRSSGSAPGTSQDVKVHLTKSAVLTP